MVRAAQTPGEGCTSSASISPKTSVYDSGRSEKMSEVRRLVSA